MRIYTNGCSFTYGDELQSPDTSAWPVLLGNLLGATTVNDGVSGGTNYRTIYRTIKQYQHNFDLYVIAWTTNTRFTFYKSDNNYEINFNPALQNSMYGNSSFYHNWGETLYNVWYNELYAFKLWLQQIIQLQSFIKAPCLMINTMHNNIGKWFAPKEQFIDSVRELINFNIMTDEQIFDEYNEIQYYVQLIDTSMFYNWNKFYIQDLCNKFPCGPNGHILEDGHTHLAELLYNHLCLK